MSIGAFVCSWLVGSMPYALADVSGRRLDFIREVTNSQFIAALQLTDIRRVRLDSTGSWGLVTENGPRHYSVSGSTTAPNGPVLITNPGQGTYLSYTTSQFASAKIREQRVSVDFPSFFATSENTLGLYANFLQETMLLSVVDFRKRGISPNSDSVMPLDFTNYYPTCYAARIVGAEAHWWIVQRGLHHMKDLVEYSTPTIQGTHKVRILGKAPVPDLGYVSYSPEVQLFLVSPTKNGTAGITLFDVRNTKPMNLRLPAGASKVHLLGNFVLAFGVKQDYVRAARDGKWQPIIGARIKGFSEDGKRLLAQRPNRSFFVAKLSFR